MIMILVCLWLLVFLVRFRDFFIFRNFKFCAKNGVKEQKLAKNNLQCCWHQFLRNYTSNDWDFLGRRCKMMIYPGLFSFLKKIDFLDQKLSKSHKWPKITCNAIHIIFCELNIIWLWPGISFIFEKFWFFGRKSGTVRRGLKSLYWCVHNFLVTINHMSMILNTLI